MKSQIIKTPICRTTTSPEELTCLLMTDFTPSVRRNIATAPRANYVLETIDYNVLSGPMISLHSQLTGLSCPRLFSESTSFLRTLTQRAVEVRLLRSSKTPCMCLFSTSHNYVIEDEEDSVALVGNSYIFG